MKLHKLRWLVAIGLFVSSTPAMAHFPWLVESKSGSGQVINVYFGETAEPDDPDLLKYVEKAKVKKVAANGSATPVELKKGDGSLTLALGKNDAKNSIFVLHHDLGVMERGDKKFHLVYFAKSGSSTGKDDWQKIDCSKHAQLDVIPAAADGKLTVTVQWDKKPVKRAQVNVDCPDGDVKELETNDKGQVELKTEENGLYSVRVRHIESKAGEVNGKDYSETRYYTTVALNLLPNKSAKSKTVPNKPVAIETAQNRLMLPRIPQPVTSFGAAIAGGHLYLYGGHTGGAHSYSNQGQDNTLWQLDLSKGSQWKSLGKGPRLQGLALVAHGNSLYRIGGFTAKNEPGDEHDLWSQAQVARYDIDNKSWTEIAPLPEPRSSFDAVVANDTIYVIGGWALRGDDDSLWHKTAYEMSLKSESPSWTKMADPPFERRALSIAALNGRIYAIGGMQSEGEPTTRVDVYDTNTKEWSQGPSLNGKPMTGFGSSAFTQSGKLYVTAIDGSFQCLAADGEEWQTLRKTPTARFFHRMLPFEKEELLVVGGASMRTGKFSEIELLTVDK